MIKILYVSMIASSLIYAATVGKDIGARSKADLAKAKAKEIQQKDINGLLSDYSQLGKSINDMIGKTKNEISNFGFHQELYGLMFDVQCERPNLDKIKVPKIHGICEKTSNKVNGVGIFGKEFDIGPCKLSIGNKKSLGERLSQWCKDDEEVVTNKKGGWISKKNSTPIEIFSTSPRAIENMRSRGGKEQIDKNTKYPSGLTVGQVEDMTLFSKMLSSDNPSVRNIVLDNDSEGYKRYIRYLTSVKGATEKKYNSIESLPLPKNQEEYEKNVNGGVETLLKITNIPTLHRSTRTLLSVGYASDKYDKAIKNFSKDPGFKKEFPDFKKKFKTLDKIDNMEDAKYRERAIYYYLVKSAKGEVGTLYATADKVDKLHSSLLESGLEQVRKKMLFPYESQLKKLPGDLRYKFVKDADKDRFKSTLLKYELTKINQLREKQKDLVLSSAQVAAEPFYPEVAYKELQKMLQKIH